MAAAANAPAPPPGAYIRRQQLQQGGGETGVALASTMGGSEASPRPDWGASSASVPPASPQGPLQAVPQPQRWSVGRDKNGAEGNLQRRAGDRDMI